MGRKRSKGESRAARRQGLLHEAARVRPPSDCDVMVVGGGAAGLAAAITAAEAGASVVVLERELECGRSILATGGGRCNFANLDLDPARYNDPEFVRAACGEGWLGSVLGFFRSSGLAWCHEEDRLYPLSRSAASVRNVLLARARRAGVVLACAREFQDATWIKPEWLGQLDPATHYDPARSATLPAGMAEVAHTLPLDDGLLLPGARTVILASGKEPLPFLGNLGLVTRRRTPVLAPIACEPSPLAELDGRRAHVVARLTRAGEERPWYEERGEVLFRSYGLSGIVIFNLSRRARPGDLIELDLVPELSEHELARLAVAAGVGQVGSASDGVSDSARGGVSDSGLVGALDLSGARRIDEGALDGVLDPTIASLLTRLARNGWSQPWSGHELPRRYDSQGDVHAPSRAVVCLDPPSVSCDDAGNELARVIRLAKALPFVVQGPAPGEQGQVMRGGLVTEQFDPATLACRAHPWLFACGEALDIDGDCGGFNLAWAWKSGMVAGASAARWALDIAD